MNTQWKLFDVEIRQETRNGLLSLSDLIEAYKRGRVFNGWVEINPSMILKSKENIQRIYYILKEKNIINLTFETYESLVETLGIVKFLKENNLYKTTGKGTTKTVWCHISIWLLFALELHPCFFAKVFDYIKDGKQFKEYHCGYADFISEDRINHENAWKHFYPEGNGKPKAGFVLHHKDIRLRYYDFERYSQWNVDDLEVMSISEHFKLHQKLGFDYTYKDRDFQLIEACDLNYSLRTSIAAKVDNPDYASINRALNIKIFGHHQTGMRNLASEADLQRLNKLQENIAFCIDMGFVHSTEDIINAIKKAKENK